MADTLLGLDIGTSATKAVLFDLSGAEQATAERAYGLDTPHPGWVEQDPERVWQAFLEVVQTIVAQAGSDSRILALALATQAGSTIPTQADGQPVYPMITWMDRRTEPLIQEWHNQGLEAKVRPISGWLLHPGLPLPTIAWLRRHRPQIFETAERFLSINDFLLHRLTGHFRTDPSCAAEMQLLNLTAGQWSPELCALAGIGPDRLSRLRPSGAIIGPVTPEISRLTGLPRRTLVINGGHDHSCEALAMGLTEAGKALLTCGTAWVITSILDTPALASIPDGMDLNFHVVPRRWTVSQLLGSFGAFVESWLKQAWQPADPETAVDRTDQYAAFNEALAATQPGSEGLFFIPGTASFADFIGLQLGHSRADMSRAVLEGPAFELRAALEHLQKADLPVEQVWLAGGATRSPSWPQILADVTGIPLTLTKYTHWAALGAAILAGVGAGVFESVQAGQIRLQKPVHHLQPDKRHQSVYDERFGAYQTIKETLSGINLSNQ